MEQGKHLEVAAQRDSNKGNTAAASRTRATRGGGGI